MDREEKIRRIKKIQRIKELQGDPLAPVEEQTPIQEEPGLGQKALEHGIEALDYIGGVARTGAASVSDLGAAGLRQVGMDLPNYETLVKPGELQEALNPFDRKFAPSGDVLLERTGLGKGGSLSDAVPGMYNETGEGWALQKGGWADPTARGAAGFAAETALDPLTYASFGIAPALKGAGKLAKASRAVKGAVDTAINNPVSAPMKALGKKMYQSAWKKVDEATGYMGKLDEYAPSEVAYRYNILGTQKQMQKKINEVLPDLKTRYDNILKNAAYQGAEVDIKAAMSEANNLIDAVLKAEKADPQLIRVAKELKNDVLQYEQMARRAPSRVVSQVESSLLDSQGKKLKMTVVEEVPGQRGVLPTEAQGFKQNLGRKTNWDSTAQLNFDEKVRKAMANGLRGQMKKAANVVDRGDELERLGREMGALLSARKPMRGEVGKEVGKNLVTTVDAMALWADPTLALAKKMGDMSKWSSVRTGSGFPLRKGAEEAGPLLDILGRRGAAQQMYTPANDRQPQSVPPMGRSTSAWQKVHYGR